MHALRSRHGAPADLPKEAASFDLPIALGILAGSGQVGTERFDRYAVAQMGQNAGRTVRVLEVPFAPSARLAAR
jgi:predicted ATPase with chaperone activity